MDVLALVESPLRTGATITANTADHCPKYLEYIGDSDNGYVSMAFTDDVEFTTRMD